MGVDTAETEKMAQLLRLHIPAERIAPLAVELSAILAWIEQLREVDVDGVEPMATPLDISLRLRKDMVGEEWSAEQILANAPDARDGFFVVPKIIE